MIKNLFANNDKTGVNEANENECDELTFKSRGKETYGYLNERHVCTLEVKQTKNCLLIEHFAIKTDDIGKGFGEKCILAFANLVKDRLKSIDTIEFAIHRATTSVRNDSDKLIKLANGRKKLLEQIGATNIEVKKMKDDCYEVRGTWHKSNWGAP